MSGVKLAEWKRERGDEKLGLSTRKALRPTPAPSRRS